MQLKESRSQVEQISEQAFHQQRALEQRMEQDAQLSAASALKASQTHQTEKERLQKEISAQVETVKQVQRANHEIQAEIARLK